MSTKNFGCFWCEGESPEENGQCSGCGADVDVSRELLGASLQAYSLERVIGRGYSGWTLLGRERFKPFAIKVVPAFRYASRGRRTDEEIERLVRCSEPSHPNIVEYVTEFSQTVALGGRDAEVACIVFTYIEAPTLNAFLADREVALTRGNIIGLLQGIAAGVERIHGRGLWHWDLHDHNILVRETDPTEHLAKYQPKIIDFGSARYEDASPPGSATERGDFHYMSKHVSAATDRFERDLVQGRQGQRITPVDRKLIRELRVLAQRLADPNVSRRDLSPAEIYREITDISARSNSGHSFASFEDMKADVGVSLKAPLSNSNALSMHAQDILLLFSDYLDWINQVDRPEVVVVVGPRGCGKTMLLRYLALPTRARPTKNEVDPREVADRLSDDAFAAFFLGVGEMRGAFQRSAYKRLQADAPDLAREFCREYLSGGLLLRTLQTVGWLASEQLAPLNPEYFDALIRLTSNSIGIEGPKVLGSVGLQWATETIERRVTDLSALRTTDYEPNSLAGDDFLERLAAAVNQIPWFSERDLWFLFDDFSATVIPEFAQEAYNPVLYRLSPNYRVRLSSEGSGPVVTDELGRRYRESREHFTVNLGQIYFRNREERGREFFERILERRFEETGVGSLDDLMVVLGEHPEMNNFGDYIRSKKRPGDARFHGFGLILRLCSGDVAFILELLHRLYSDDERNTDGTLSAARQDVLVKEYAQRKLSDLKSIPEYGDRLFAIAERFGTMLRSYIEHSKNDRPDERLRVEIGGVREFPEDVQQLHDALLRHNVLVPGGTGKDRSGRPTQRYFVRRLYAPCFPFSPNRRGTIALNVAEYSRWLREPGAIRRTEQRELL